jgi:hypothetical protein
MAKAVVPMQAFREKFGVLESEDIGARLQQLVAQFLHEAPREVKGQKAEVRSEAKQESEEVKLR